MSEYLDLVPISASSTMHIVKDRDLIKFTNNIVYDYIDSPQNKSNNYFHFLSNSKNYNQEIALYWENLQRFLDDEINRINQIDVNLTIKHCVINFRDSSHPYVQWIVEFIGKCSPHLNTYENIIEKEQLPYPIYSLYIFDSNLRISNVKSSLEYSINDSRHIVEYWGQPGDQLDGYEKIDFQIL